jgi:hypothetical protein
LVYAARDRGRPWRQGVAAGLCGGVGDGGGRQRCAAGGVAMAAGGGGVRWRALMGGTLTDAGRR